MTSEYENSATMNTYTSSYNASGSALPGAPATFNDTASSVSSMAPSTASAGTSVSTRAARLALARQALETQIARERVARLELEAAEAEELEKTLDGNSGNLAPVGAESTANLGTAGGSNMPLARDQFGVHSLKLWDSTSDPQPELVGEPPGAKL